MKRERLMLLLSIILFFPWPVTAQEGKEGEKSVIMEEVVVTATKTEEKRKDISNSVIIIDEMDIQESSSSSVGELLSNETGIDLRDYGDYGGAAQEIRIRGMSSNATQVLINGVSINSPSLGSADVSLLPLNNIERIEIVKGAGSLLYGSGAMGGTINIITKNPVRDENRFIASAGYGENNSYLLSAEQGMFACGDFGYFLTVNRSETDGFRDNSDLEHNDVSLKLILDKGEDMELSLYGDYIDRKYGLPGAKPPAGTKDYYVGGTKFYNSESASLVNKGANKDGHGIISFKKKVSDLIKINMKQDYIDTESYNLNRNAAALWPKAAGEGEKTWVINKVAGTEGIIEIAPDKNAGLILGAEYKGFDYEKRANDVDANGADTPGTRSDENYHVFTKGAYIEGRYSILPCVKVTAGVRRESHSTFGHEVLPRYGMVINPYEKTFLKFSHGKQFRAPTLNDLYWPDDGWTRGNPDLRPEKGWHSDVTLEQGLLGDKLFMTVSYFSWDVADKIAWAENPNFPTVFPGINKWTPSNVYTYEGDGWELGAKIGPFNNMLLSFNYTLMDAEEQKTVGPKRRALETPENQFKGSITYWAPYELTLGLTLRYVGNRPANYASDTADEPQNMIDSYWTADFQASYPVNDHWTVSARGINLFDKEYYTDTMNFQDQSTGVTTRQGYPGIGRYGFLYLTYEY
jgi:outer membrane cobalamin receptor